ncbi:hypothetical protein BDQ17DRAFT_1412918 [Cyathus striatus]|nr:hypothetical protein BDQ17DRAFT_1412918 [Cyathus striatus]
MSTPNLVQEARVEVNTPKDFDVGSLATAMEDIFKELARQIQHTQLSEKLFDRKHLEKSQEYEKQVESGQIQLKSPEEMLLLSAIDAVNKSAIAASYGYLVAKEALELSDFVVKNGSNPKKNKRKGNTILINLKTMILLANEGRLLAEEIEANFIRCFNQSTELSAARNDVRLGETLTKFHSRLKEFVTWWNLLKMKQTSLRIRAECQYELKSEDTWADNGFRDVKIHENWKELQSRFRTYDSKLSTVKREYSKYIPHSQDITSEPLKLRPELLDAIKSVTISKDFSASNDSFGRNKNNSSKRDRLGLWFAKCSIQ